MTLRMNGQNMMLYCATLLTDLIFSLLAQLWQNNTTNIKIKLIIKNIVVSQSNLKEWSVNPLHLLKAQSGNTKEKY
jgi:hypothetical protein